ncbi:class I SAM-dependent methyltransferase [Lachnospiraceae bacterium OttesenSCG-928-E19]|nr:class I SAM-dependent methyltransferase [Lachnospiraceae bacterium OttesenSCG-928-E19]
MAVVKQIQEIFPDAKTILDIGSGWGTMVRTVAKKNRNAQVVGVEILFLPYVYSIIRSVFVRNAKFVRGDAFKYINKDNKKFDIGITYLLTPEMRNVQKVLSHFDVLISVDFPLPDIKPTHKIKIHRDFLAQHWLYVYKK